MRKNFWNAVLIGLALLTWTLGAWQLDLLVSPYIWGNDPLAPREVLPYLYVPTSVFYVLTFIAMFLALPLLFLALWFWQD